MKELRETAGADLRSDVSPRVLVIDDDVNLLSSLRRQLGQRFNLAVTACPDEALGRLRSNESFAVIVSDMWMPRIDGIELLKRARELSPHTSRIMLTGNIEHSAAVEAINLADVFRYHTKPCAPPELVGSIEAGITAWRGRMNCTICADEVGWSKLERFDFLLTLSHELRTPLNHVVGFAELLQSQAMRPEKCREYISHILNSGLRLSAVIDSLLLMIDLRTGHYQFQPEAVAFDTIIEEAYADVARLEEAAGLQFNVELSTKTGMVQADRTLLRVLLFELLSNAAKFNRSQGNIRLSVTEASGAVELTVEDDGIGIAGERIEALMRPFVQAKHPAIAGYGGLGVGLPLVQAIAELHGGKLKIVSKLDEGTIASVRLPGWTLERGLPRVVPAISERLRQDAA